MEIALEKNFCYLLYIGGMLEILIVVQVWVEIKGFENMNAGIHVNVTVQILVLK